MDHTSAYARGSRSPDSVRDCGYEEGDLGAALPGDRFLGTSGGLWIGYRGWSADLEGEESGEAGEQEGGESGSSAGVRWEGFSVEYMRDMKEDYGYVE